MATATIRTVRRNSKEAQEMWDKATRAISYTLANYFIGEDVTIEGAHNWFERMAVIKPKITESRGVYTIHYHSNHWINLLVPPSDES